MTGSHPESPRVWWRLWCAPGIARSVGADGAGSSLGDDPSRSKRLPGRRCGHRVGCDWHTANRVLLAWGKALLAADADRVAAVGALGLDETLFGCKVTWRTRGWCTSIVDMHRGQLFDLVPGRDAPGPIRWLLAQLQAWRQSIDWGVLDLSGRSGAPSTWRCPTLARSLIRSLSSAWRGTPRKHSAASMTSAAFSSPAPIPANLSRTCAMPTVRPNCTVWAEPWPAGGSPSSTCTTPASPTAQQKRATTRPNFSTHRPPLHQTHQLGSLRHPRGTITPTGASNPSSQVCANVRLFCIRDCSAISQIRDDWSPNC